MAEEIDLELCNFRNFRRSVTLILDQVEVTLVRTSGRGLPTHQIKAKSETFVDGWTDMTGLPVVCLLGYRLAMT